jgi:uncharacterized protein (DUF58 family)
VDWKVFGKTDRYYIKQFEEETNMRVSILIDCSESMKYNSKALTKYEYGSCIAASLSYLLLNQQDSVGITLFDNTIRSEISPSTNPGILKNIVNILEHAPNTGTTRIDELFLKVISSIKRKGMVIIISDFFVNLHGLEEALKNLASRGHSVFMFHVMDRAELEFPFNALTMFKGLEEEEDLLLDPNAIRKGYLREVNEYLEQIKRTAIKNRINYYLMDTSAPLGITLSSILTTHGGRKKA